MNICLYSKKRDKKMLNNYFNERINKEMKHSFSIMDIDGCVLKNYKFRDHWKKRLILYETKNIGEELTETQLQTLRTLFFNINWQKFDKKSGVYVFNDKDGKFDEVEVKGLFGKKCFTLKFNEFFDWFNANEVYY